MKPRQRRLSVGLAAAVAVASAAGSFVLSTQAAGGAEAEAASPTVAVLSPRRAPAAFRRLVADTRLASRVDVVMRSLPPTACVVVKADDETIAADNPDELLMPASTLKLTTAAAFLSTVGGTGHFTTTVEGPRPDAAGTVNGDVDLIGGGDPLLAHAGYVTSRKHPPTPATDVTQIAAALEKDGVKHITGGIGVYDGIFDNERRVASWSAAYTANGDVGPIGALAVDDGFSAYTPRLIAAPDPAIAAGDAVRAALAAAGIAVDGATFRVNQRPAATPLASVQSAPYADVVGEMLRESDNNTAELLLKELARHTSGTTGTRAAGVAARTAALEKLGLKAHDVQAIDGSGLDRSDRTDCHTLLATLTAKPGGYDLENMLAVAGETGTLDDRFLTTPLVHKLRGKTGSLDGVTALVGVADPKAPVKIRFAFIVNGAFDDPGGKALQDRLVAALATYPEVPSVAAIQP